MYRGRADCERRIKELKADFGLDSFVLRDFWATEAALGVTMLAYHLMSVFRHAVMRQTVHHTLATLYHKVELAPFRGHFDLVPIQWTPRRSKSVAHRLDTSLT